MPRGKRKAVEDDDEEEEAGGGGGGSSQAPSSLASAVSPLSPEETQKLANELVRYVLLREHAKKPIARNEAKKAVLKDRPDGGGKIMRALMALANEKLVELMGCELRQAVDAADGAADDDAEASQSQGASQGASQSSSQGTARANSSGRYILVNLLEGPDGSAPVKSDPNKQMTEYNALCEVVLQLLAHAEGSMEEAALLDHWLGSKLRVARDYKLPNQKLSIGDLVTKTMVSDAYLKKGKNSAGDVTYSVGPRAILSRDVKTADAFAAGL